MMEKNFLFKALAIAGAIILIVMAFASIVQAKELEIPVEAQEASQDCEVTINFTNNKVLIWKEEFSISIPSSDFGSGGVVQISISPTGASWRMRGEGGTKIPIGTKIPFEPVLIHSWESTCEGTNPKMTAQVHWMRSSTNPFEIDSSRGMRGVFSVPFRSGSLITTEGAGISYVTIKVTGLK